MMSVSQEGVECRWKTLNMGRMEEGKEEGGEFDGSWWRQQFG